MNLSFVILQELASLRGLHIDQRWLVSHALPA